MPKEIALGPTDKASMNEQHDIKMLLHDNEAQSAEEFQSNLAMPAEPNVEQPSESIAASMLESYLTEPLPSWPSQKLESVALGLSEPSLSAL